MEKTYPISEALLNEVFSILGNLPYVQSAGVIAKLHAITKSPISEAIPVVEEVKETPA